MQISVKLIGHLLDDVPNGANFNGAEFSVDDGTTVATLAKTVGLQANSEYFVMINGAHVVQPAWPSRELSHGDKVVYCPPLKGG